MADPGPGVVCGDCGTPLVGSYCHRCGQRHMDLAVSFRQLLSDLLREALDIEARMVKTLKLLLARPGDLTAAYLEGHRRSYVSPGRLYLLSSMVFGAGLALSAGFLNVSLQGGAPDRAAWLRGWVWSVLFMTPTFAALLLLVVRRGYRFVEHLVLALHVHAFGFLVAGSGLLALSVLRLGPWVDISVLLGVPLLIVFYLVVTLRRRYTLSWPSAAIASAVVTGVYVVVQFATLILIGSIVDRLGA